MTQNDAGALARRVQHVAQCRAAGRRDLEDALAAGTITRVRRGWYGAADAHPEVIEAVRVGGALTGPSAAVLYGLWVPPDDRLHVSVPRNASRLRLKPPLPHSRSSTKPVCIHWSRSAGQSYRVTAHSLSRSFECLPARYRQALARADGTSESGIETLVRLRLRSRGISLKTQFRHLGVGRFDLLVGQRLVIEVDGRIHRDSDAAFVSDRERDLILFRDGFERLRLTYGHVMFRWPEVEAVIVENVRRRRHLWRSTDRPDKRPPLAAQLRSSARPST